MADNELQHYGIPKMKWGIRRYQYPDGTLTPEGRKRYGVGDARSSDGDSSASRSSSSSSSSTQSTQPAQPKSASEMTDAELNAFINRYNMEQRYKQIIETQSQEQTQLPTEIVSTKSPKTVYEMSDKEIQAFLNRVELEKKYNAVVNPPAKPKEKSAARKFVDSVLLAAGTEVATKWAKQVMSNILLKEDSKKDETKKDDSASKRLDSIEKILKDLRSGTSSSSGSNTSSSSSSEQSKPKDDKFVAREKKKVKKNTSSFSDGFIDRMFEAAQQVVNEESNLEEAKRFIHG